MSIKGNRATAVGLAVGVALCLVITALMTKQAGVAQAATEDGKLLLGWAGVIIHITTLVFFGLTAGALASDGKKTAAFFTYLVVLGGAAFTAWNVMGFVGQERLSLSKARQAQIEALDARKKMVADEHKARLDAQLALVKDSQKFLETQTKEVEGRKSRKDMMEGMRKNIEAVGNTTITTVESTPQQPVIMQRPDGGSELISEVTGLDRHSVALAYMAYLALLLVVVETVGWPAVGYMWRNGGRKPETVQEQPESPPQLPPPSAIPEAKAPQLANAAPPGKVITLRAEPTPEWRALLDEIDYPKKRLKELRRKDKRDHLGLRWMTWIAAYKEGGEQLSVEYVDNLFTDFCNGDFRVSWADRIAKMELVALGPRYVTRTTWSPVTWTIKPPTIERMRAMLVKAGVIKAPLAITDTRRETGKPQVPFRERFPRWFKPAANDRSGADEAAGSSEKKSAEKQRTVH